MNGNSNYNHAVLSPMIEGYLQKRRALGRQFYAEERILINLCQFLTTIGAQDLNQDNFESWCHSFEGLHPNTRRYRQRVVRNFCLYRQRTEPECYVPDINQFVRPVPHQTPVIISNTNVACMLGAAKALKPSNNSPLRPDVMRLAVVLLYTAGLRRGELLRLSLADIEPQRGILHIRESKFYKSRFVPLSHDALDELRYYLKKRLAQPFDLSPTAALLINCSRGWRSYTGTGISNGIHTLFEIAKVHGTDGRKPRVHDLRHNFAIAVLTRWYQQGVDVQSNLPKLAMYMGHVNIVSTAYYLQLIPEIAEMASQRFESEYGHLISGGGQ